MSLFPDMKRKPRVLLQYGRKLSAASDLVARTFVASLLEPDSAFLSRIRQDHPFRSAIKAYEAGWRWYQTPNLDVVYHISNPLLGWTTERERDDFPGTIIGVLAGLSVLATGAVGWGLTALYTVGRVGPNVDREPWWGEATPGFDVGLGIGTVAAATMVGATWYVWGKEKLSKVRDFYQLMLLSQPFPPGSLAGLALTAIRF